MFELAKPNPRLAYYIHVPTLIQHRNKRNRIVNHLNSETMEILALGLVSISLFYVVIFLVMARFLPKMDNEPKKSPKTFYRKFSKRLLSPAKDDQEVAA